MCGRKALARGEWRWRWGHDDVDATECPDSGVLDEVVTRGPALEVARVGIDVNKPLAVRIGRTGCAASLGHADKRLASIDNGQGALWCWVL